MNAEFEPVVQAMLAADSAIVRWPEKLSAGNDITRVMDAIDSNRFHAVWVDVEPVEDKSSLLTALYTALQLPSWFGFNYDALQDALEMLEPFNGCRWVLVFKNFNALERNDPECARIFLDIFRQAADVEGNALHKLVLL